MRIHPASRATAVAVACVLASTSGAAAAPPADPTPHTAPATYTNPVFPGNFADPSVIRGRDGAWYAYGTWGALFPTDDEPARIPILRSTDLVHWSSAGEVVDTEPSWPGEDPSWTRHEFAPDITYFGGRYHLYYQHTVHPNPGHYSEVGVATAPTPTGPWTDSPSNPVVEKFTWEPFPGVERQATPIGPRMITDSDGTHYLSYGSGGAGIYVQRLSRDGTTPVGDRIRLAASQIHEASYLVHHGAFWYLFTSSLGGCCDGPASAYPNRVGRSRTVTGPYVDRLGRRLDADDAAGTLVQVPNGNRWTQVGYTSVVTDLSGQQYLFTNGVDRFDPYRGGSATKRQLLLTRLDWIDGWPVSRGGEGVTDAPRPAPDATGTVADSFEDGISAAWRPTARWHPAHEAAGGYVHTAGATSRSLLSTATLGGNLSARADVRLGAGASGGLVLGQNEHQAVRALLDRASGLLTVAAVRDGAVVAHAAARLPGTFDYSSWHRIVATRRGGRLTVTVSGAGLFDPVARVHTALPPGIGAGHVGAFATGGSVDADALGFGRLAAPHRGEAPDPSVGPVDPAHGDEFDGALDAGWSWVRKDDSVRVRDGKLVFPVQHATLIDGDARTYPLAYPPDTASVLLREPPAGDTWTVQTRVSVPYGDTYPRTHPQAGLVVYASDDSWLSLGDTAQSSVRWVNFGQELEYGTQTTPLYGWAGFGPVADTTYLRLRHTIDPDTGEHLLRAASSIDGTHWVWQGSRPLPAGAHLRVGLAAFNAPQDTDYAATFDYLRVRTP